MKPVIISTEGLSRSPRVFADTNAGGVTQLNRFADLPLQARLLLAVPRVRGVSTAAPLAERYVLDTLGRIIDAGPERRNTIDAVNLLAEVLLTPGQFDSPCESTNKQWLSSLENVVLCVLCKVRSGHTEDAAKLMNHWLSRTTVENFNSAAQALCNAECFKRGGPHVFTPGWSGTTSGSAVSKHRSVSYTGELTLGELLLLNAIRLRVRTLPYSGINVRVVPLLSKNLALPKIEALVDAHLIEALQHGKSALDIRCLCCSEVSVNEAHFLAAVTAFSTADAELITHELGSWLPQESVERLKSRTGEFHDIIQNIGTALPMRNWDMNELRNRSRQKRYCKHVSEPSMIH